MSIEDLVKMISEDIKNQSDCETDGDEYHLETEEIDIDVADYRLVD